MARIPKLAERARISTNVQKDPTLDPSTASSVTRGQAALGSQISQGLGKLYKRQQIEADKASYTKASIEATKGANQSLRELDLAFDGTDYTGYADKGLDTLRKQNDEIIRQAPEGIREQLRLSLDSKMVGYEQKLRSQEAHRKSKYAINQTSDQIVLAGHDSYSKWDPMENMEKKSLIRSQIATSTQYDADTKRALDKKIANISNDMVSGVYDRADINEMQAAVSDLRDGDMQLLFADMSPIDKAKSIAKLERRIESKQKEEAYDTSRKGKEVIFSLESGTLRSNNPKDREAIEAVKSAIASKMDKEDAAVMLNDIQTAEVVNELTTENAVETLTLNPEVAAKFMMDENADRLEGAVQEAKIISKLSAIQNSMKKEFKENPVDFLVKYDRNIAEASIAIMSPDTTPQEFKEYINLLDSHYNNLKISKSDRRYLPSGIASHYSKNIKTLMAEGNPAAASLLLDELHNKSGGEMYRFYDELKLPEGVASVFEVSSEADRRELLTTISKYEDDISPRFKLKSSEQELSIKKKLINSDFYKSVLNRDGGRNPLSGKQAGALLNTAVMEYKNAVLNGSTPEEAEGLAWDKFNKSYDIVENGSYPIPVRKNGKYNADVVQNFVDKYTNTGVDYVNEFDIKVPDKYNMEEMNDSLKDGGFWSYNKKSDSLRLLYRNPRSNKVETAIDRKTGNPLKVSLEDISRLDIKKQRKSILRNVMKAHKGMEREFRRELPNTLDARRVDGMVF